MSFFYNLILMHRMENKKTHSLISLEVRLWREQQTVQFFNRMLLQAISGLFLVLKQ